MLKTPNHKGLDDPEHNQFTGCFHASVILSNEQEVHTPSHDLKRLTIWWQNYTNFSEFFPYNQLIWVLSNRKTLNPKTCMTGNQLNSYYHSSVTLANEHETQTVSHDLKGLRNILMTELCNVSEVFAHNQLDSIFQTHFLQQRCTAKTMQEIFDRDHTHTWVMLLLEVRNPWWSLLYIPASQICTPPPSLLPTSELKWREGACLASVRPEKRRWWRGGWRVVHSNSKLRRCPQMLLSRLLLARPPDIPLSR